MSEKIEFVVVADNLTKKKGTRFKALPDGEVLAWWKAGGIVKAAPKVKDVTDADA
jgi:hypothetical protein